MRAALVQLAVGALAGAFELLALQAPGSALYLGVLPGPVAHLRELSLVLGLLLLGADTLAARAAAGRLLVRTLTSSAALATLAQAYGATQGMYGLQAQDLRADALPLFLAKYGALLSFVLAFAQLGRRALGPAASRPPT